MRRSACHATTAVRRPADRAPSGQGSTVCKSRYIAAAIAIRRQAKAAQRTPEQAAELAAILAGLVARCGADIGRARRGEALITAGDANPRAQRSEPGGGGLADVASASGDLHILAGA